MFSMESKAMMTFVWRSNLPLILFGIVFIASVQLLLIYFNSTLDFIPMVEVMLSQMPPAMSEMFGDEILSQISAEGTVAFGLEHPLVITLFTFLSVSVISRHLGSGSGNQFMEIILSHPFKRSVLLNSIVGITIVIIVLFVLAAFLGALSAIFFFHELDPVILTRMIQANINAVFLHLFIMALTLFLCVYYKDAGKAVRLSAVITLVFYFIDIIADLWDKFKFTKHFNFFAYFDPPEIMIGHDMVYRDMLILLIASLILYVISLRIFLRKDVF